MDNTKALEVTLNLPTDCAHKYTVKQILSAFGPKPEGVSAHDYLYAASMALRLKEENLTLRTQLADAQKQLAAVDTGQHHIGYSITNKCWFVRLYGYKTEDEAKTALHYLTTPRLVPSDCVDDTRQPTQDKGGE